MATIQQTMCDHCGKLLKGKEGTAWVNEDFINVPSNVTLVRWNKELGRDVFVYIGKKDRSETLSFCDHRCFGDYLKMKEDVLMPKILESLRTGKKIWELDNDEEDYQSRSSDHRGRW